MEIIDMKKIHVEFDGRISKNIKNKMNKKVNLLNILIFLFLNAILA
jgi:hypothetical protein